MRSATLFCLLTTACFGSLVSCGSAADDGNLLITVSGLPTRVITLSITATLGGVPAMSAQQVAPPSDGKFGVVLPSGSSGHFVLNIQATDADGCLQATGMIDTTLTGKYTELPVALTAQTPRKCGNLPGCAADTICSYLPKPSNSTLWGLWGSSPTDIWAVGDSSTVLHFDGTSWQASQVPSPYYYYSVWGSGPKDVWAVGQLGTIIHFDGKSWTATTNPARNDLTGVYGVSATEVWAVGIYYVRLYRASSCAGMASAGKRVLTGYSASLLSVFATSATDIIATGLGGTILRYNGVGAALNNSGTANDLRSVWGTGPNQLFAVGGQGTVLRYDGTAWSKIMVTGYAATLYAIGGDQTNIYGVGNSNASGNTIKATAPFSSFNVQGSTANDLTSVIIGSNGIGWVTGKLGYLGYFDTRP